MIISRLDILVHLLIERVLAGVIREHPLMTSNFSEGRGVQNDPKIGRFRVEKGR